MVWTIARRELIDQLTSLRFLGLYAGFFTLAAFYAFSRYDVR